MKNPLTIIWDFILNIIRTGLQWVTIVVMFPFKLLNKLWIGFVRFLGRCLIKIGNFLAHLRFAIETIITVILVIIGVSLALAIALFLIQELLWLLGGMVFGIGWLLMLAGAFMMAHIIATGIIIVLIIIIILLLLIYSSRHGVLNGC